MRNFLKCLTADFKKSNLSSWKRLIKLFGICIVPILYGVTCILAFWNPIQSFDRATIGIMDSDNPVGIVVYSKIGDDSKNETFIKIATDENGAILQKNNFDSIYSKSAFSSYKEQMLYFSDSSHLVLTKINGQGENVFTGDDKSIYIINTFKYSTLARVMIESGKIFTTEKKGNDIYSSVYGFSVSSNDRILNFRKIHYISGPEATKDYKSNKYNIQLHFNESFTYNMITSLSSVITNIANVDILNGFSSIQQLLKVFNGLEIYSSFSQNFIFGIFMTTLKNFDYAIIANIIDKISKQMDTPSQLGDILSTINPKIKDKLASIAKILTFNSIDVVSEANKKITIYGFGLGQMFLLIGLTAGSIATTFVIDKSKRVKKATNLQWFFSKYLHLLIIGGISAIILISTTFACGWYILGVVKYFQLVLWFLFYEIILNGIFCSLWFIFRSEAMGRWLMFLYTLLNIVVGWGSFPSFMMPAISNYLSYLTIYRWSNLATLHIIFANYDYSNTIIISILASLLIATFFLLIGGWCSIFRYRDVHYGSYKGKYVMKGLIELKISTEEFYISRVERKIYLLKRKKNFLLINYKYTNVIDDYKKEISYLDHKFTGLSTYKDKRKNILEKRILRLEAKIDKIDTKKQQDKIDKIDKIIKNIESLEHKSSKNKYNWKFLEDIKDIDLIMLNKKTNAVNNTYKGFSFYEAWEDKTVHLPNQSDSELVSRND
ncbi:hypothetical protein [Spiroplasma endosymbiont of Aspidapion aeneum]|uniref:hypothetical protein n=1 Tax=Spiroplasma endosymbiont of Aspidapion aeneum TaxID=3066276 RepID=UPI00313C047E